tara:strand:- start:304 stop:1527 length:1224 start_codon:yes stop_codon:yes gene_type:complete
MAKQTIVTYPQVAKDSGLGTPLADAFKMVNDNFDELYTDDTNDVSSIIATAPIARNNATGVVTISLTDGGIITQKIADDAVTEDKLANSINSLISANTAKTGITSGQANAITANTAKTGITSSQAADIVTNNNKNTDQTVTLSEGANVTITGTYPNFEIASNDVVGAVSSVNGQTAVVVLDTADISEDTNLYYTEARVVANSAVTLNTAKTGISSTQASDITANNLKISNATHTGEVTGSAGSTALTIANDAVTTVKIANANITVGKMAANSVDSDQYVDGSIDTVHIADNQITFAKLEERYTELSALGSGTAFALNFSTATTFTATASNPATFTFSDAVQGQVIDLIIDGNHALTFAETGATFNKVGSTSYAGGSTNLIQIICTDDSSGAKIYHYSIATYAVAQPQ